jgi:hypothetical protein
MINPPVYLVKDVLRLLISRGHVRRNSDGEWVYTIPVPDTEPSLLAWSELCRREYLVDPEAGSWVRGPGIGNAPYVFLTSHGPDVLLGIGIPLNSVHSVAHYWHLWDNGIELLPRSASLATIKRTIRQILDGGDVLHPARSLGIFPRRAPSPPPPGN